MKRWKNWAGIILSLTLAAACIPEMSVHAGNYVTAEKSLLFGAVAGMPAGNSAGEQTSKEASSQEGTESIFEIFVGNGQSIPQYQAGQNIEKLTVRVVNKGDSDLQNVKIVPVIEDTADWPFEMDGIRHGYFWMRSRQKNMQRLHGKICMCVRMWRQKPLNWYSTFLMRKEKRNLSATDILK